MANRFDLIANNSLMIGSAATATKTGLALGSVYVYATSGAAIGYRFVAPTSGNLTDVWFFVSAIAGTPGVTTVELRNNISGSIVKPGVTQLAVQTITPGVTANKWINAHFATPYSVTINTEYWVVIGDAGWTTGNTATVLSLGGLSSSITTQFRSHTTADGFTTNGTATQGTPALVLKFADGTLLGSPYTTFVADTTSSLERGLKISGFTEDIIISGISFNPGSTMTGLKVYSGATAPGGTTLSTITFGAGISDLGFSYFSPVLLRKNTVYRLVLTFSGNTTAPGYIQIEDYATSTDLTNAGFGGGTIYRTVDNGSGGWTDNIDLVPRILLLVKDQSVQPGSLINGGVLSEA